MRNIIQFTNRKGGVGKSTIASNMATLAKIAGLDVVLVDGDEQGTSQYFCEIRAAKAKQLPSPVTINVSGTKAGDTVDDLAEKYDLVIVDLAGGDSDTLRSTLQADALKELYVPTGTSINDLAQVPFMAELASTYSRRSRPLHPTAIINRAPSNVQTKVTEKAIKYINSVGDIALAETILKERLPTQKAQAAGLTVPEYHAIEQSKRPGYQRVDSKAGQEMLKLFVEIVGRPFGADMKKLAAYMDALEKGTTVKDGEVEA